MFQTPHICFLKAYPDSNPSGAPWLELTGLQFPIYWLKLVGKIRVFERNFIRRHKVAFGPLLKGGGDETVRGDDGGRQNRSGRGQNWARGGWQQVEWSLECTRLPNVEFRSTCPCSVGS